MNSRDPYKRLQHLRRLQLQLLLTLVAATCTAPAAPAAVAAVAAAPAPAAPAAAPALLLLEDLVCGRRRVNNSARVCLRNPHTAGDP